MALEDLHPTSGVGGPERVDLSGNDRDVSECVMEGGSLLMETPSSSSIASKSSTSITENILYMKLFHEFKQLYPKVPDDTVIQCVRQYGTDRKRCNDILSVEADRAVSRRFSLQDLLSHQMHQQLKLSEHLKYEKKELQHISCEVRDLEMKLDRRQLQLRAKLTPQNKSQIEHHLEELQNNCQNLADEVTELTNGKVPLGETSFEFYESLPLIMSNTNPLPHSSSREFKVEVENNSREVSAPLPKGVSILENDDSTFATLETLAKPLPPPNRSTFYVPIAQSPTSRSGLMSSPTHQTTIPSSGPSSPLGEVADTVISGTMAGVHAVLGVPSAVSSLPIYDGEERVSGRPDDRLPIEPEITTNESGDIKEPQWSCAECTFLNHPALKECEQCEMPRVMIGTDLHRTHQAKNCFCHPQDGQMYNPPSLPSLPVRSSATNNSLHYNNSQKQINEIEAATKNEDIELKDEGSENIALTEVTNESSKVSVILKETIDKDDSASSESTPCT